MHSAIVCNQNGVLFPLPLSLGSNSLTDASVENLTVLIKTAKSLRGLL